MKRPTTCPGSSQRCSAPQSSAFPEVRCPHCEYEARPVLDDKALGRYRVRSHRPKGALRIMDELT